MGQIAEGVKSGAFNYLLRVYYNQVLGLPGTMAGLALFAATFFDAVTDPLAGSLSDRLQHRWGRRHPFMYASAIPLGLFFAMLFSPPDDLSERGLFLWLLVMAVAVRASMTLYHVPHAALGAELSTDYTERTTIVAFRTAFGLGGIMLTGGMAWLYFFPRAANPEQGQLDPSVYPPFGLFFGLIMAVSVLLSAWGTHDRIPHLPQPAPDEPRLDVRTLFRDYAGALSNDSFRPFFFGIVVFYVMRGIQETLSVHMSTFFWALDSNSIAAVAFSSFPGFVVGVPFWTLAARRIDKRPAFLAGIALFSLMVLGPPIAKIVGFYPVASSPFYIGILMLASGLAAFAASAGIVMAGSMRADVADEHELHTHRRQEGIFFGALAFAGKSTSGLGTFIGGLALDLIHFPTQADPSTIPIEKIDALGFFYGPGIMLFAVVAMLLLSRYRIDRRRHAEIARALNARRSTRAEEAS